MILFGSCIGRKFALDTVFVVCDDYVDYSPQNYDALLQQVDQTYRIVTINPIVKQIGKACNKTCVARIIPQTLRSYRGAAFDNQVDGIFSFFPCQAYTRNSLGFARPTIQMPTISDTQTRGIKITRCSVDNINNYWSEVVKQVTETCSLGIFAEMPTESEVDTK